jgi:uncharacterized membrane protein YhaH (DUF805 family)
VQLQAIDRFNPKNSLEIYAYAEPAQPVYDFNTRGMRWQLLYLTGRLNRSGFIVGNLVMLLVGWIMKAIPLFFIAAPLQILVFWMIFALCGKRLHDFNKSSKWALLLLCMPILLIATPYFGIQGMMFLAFSGSFLSGLLIVVYAALFIFPGSKGTNRFG